MPEIPNNKSLSPIAIRGGFYYDQAGLSGFSGSKRPHSSYLHVFLNADQHLH